MSSQPLRDLLDRALPHARLEDSRLPCHVLATDALDGTGVLLSRGCTTSALLASAAIPAVFPPIDIEGRPLIDGGLATDTPLDYATRLGATRLIVLPTGTPCALREPPRGVFASAIHALNLLSMRQLLADIERCGATCELHVVPRLCPLRVSPYDFSHTAVLNERAAASTRDWLRGGMAPRDPHWALLPHRH
jgi:NTE family protein